MKSAFFCANGSDHFPSKKSRTVIVHSMASDNTLQHNRVKMNCNVGLFLAHFWCVVLPVKTQTSDSWLGWPQQNVVLDKKKSSHHRQLSSVNHDAPRLTGRMNLEFTYFLEIIPGCLVSEWFTHLPCLLQSFNFKSRKWYLSYHLLS